MIADYVRAKAIWQSDDDVSWLIDLDTIWFKPAAKDSTVQKAAADSGGHVFASFQAAQAFLGSAKDRQEFFKREFLKTPNDDLYLGTPFRLPVSSPFTLDFIKFFEARYITATPSISPKHKKYNENMKEFKRLLKLHKLQKAVVNWDVFSPLHYERRSKHCQTPKKSKTCSEEPWTDSVGCNNFWQSSRNKKQELPNIATSSPWDLVMQKAYATHLKLILRQCFSGMTSAVT